MVYVNKYGRHTPNVHINSDQHSTERYLLARIGLITLLDLEIVDEWCSNNQHFGGVGVDVVVSVNKYRHHTPDFYINSNQHSMERYLLTRIV